MVHKPRELRCEQVLERLDDAVSGALPPEEQAAVQAHLATCQKCALFGERYAQLVTRLGELKTAGSADEADVDAILRRVDPS